MTDHARLRDDIAYVRAAAEQSSTVPVPAIHFLWALLVFVGFGLVDVVDDGRWIGGYWALAGPAGFGLSAWIGRRADRQAGRIDRKAGLRHVLHWATFMSAGVLGLALVQAGHLTWRGFGSLWVLLAALTYVQAGLHLERSLLPVGLLLAGGFLVTLWLPGFGWTATGTLLAIALVATAFTGKQDREPAG